MKNKIFALILTVAIFFSACPPAAKAEIWGSNFGAGFMKQVLEVIYDIVMDAIMVALKKEAIDMVKDEITGSIVGDDIAFITDWQKEMFTNPQSAATTYINDFLSATTRGKCSSSDYSSGGSGDYLSYLCGQARSMAIEAEPMETDIDEYMTDPSEMFDDGNWSAFSAFFQGNNNPIALSLTVQREMISKMSQEEEKAKTQAIAYAGFKGTQEGGQTITPGSISKEVLAKSETIQLEQLANTEKWTEIIGQVIASAITRSIKDGIGDVKEKIQAEVNSTVGQYQQQMQGVERYQ